MSWDHFHSSLPNLGDGSWDVHHLLFLYLLQDVVNDDECTCATHTRTIHDKIKMCNIIIIISEVQLCFIITCSVLEWVSWRDGAEP